MRVVVGADFCFYLIQFVVTTTSGDLCLSLYKSVAAVVATDLLFAPIQFMVIVSLIIMIPFLYKSVSTTVGTDLCNPLQKSVGVTRSTDLCLLLLQFVGITIGTDFCRITHKSMSTVVTRDLYHNGQKSAPAIVRVVFYMVLTLGCIHFIPNHSKKCSSDSHAGGRSPSWLIISHLFFPVAEGISKQSVILRNP